MSTDTAVISLTLHFPGLPVFVTVKESQLCPCTKLHCKGAGGRGTPHNMYRSEQNQVYCSAVPDYAVGDVLLVWMQREACTVMVSVHSSFPSSLPCKKFSFS